MESSVDKHLKDIASKSISEEHIHPSKNEDIECLVSVKSQVIYTSRGRAVRNVIILGISYFLFFTGFWSLSNLQSTMNAEGGLGPDAQALVYLCSMVSCFIPDMMIGKFGCKYTFIIALIASCPYIAANFRLRWDTMMAAAVLYGLASGPLNAALTLHIDEMASRYSANSDESRENVEAFFFGANMLFAECTQILGNTVSYLILVKGKHIPPPRNFSIETECGIHFRPGSENDTNTNMDPPSDSQRLMLTGVFLGLGILAVIVALLLDSLKNDVKDINGCNSVWKKFTSAVKHLRNPHQLMLIPLSMYCGMEGVFYSNEFTQAFIACSWGVHHVGFVSICFGVCGALMAILVGPLVKCISQMSVIILAALINVVTCGLLFVWQPSPDVPSAYFIFAGVWGMTDAIWWSQVAALYGLMFPNDREAAFSNLFFWSFLGYFISYAYANYFTVAVKLYIMLVILISGITLYVIGQIKLRCSSRSLYVDIGKSE